MSASEDGLTGAAWSIAAHNDLPNADCVAFKVDVPSLSIQLISCVCDR
jgi:hypothetical protein